MTHEEFAHICLKIKSGDTSIEIPCCANCKYYKTEENCGSIHGFTSFLENNLIKDLCNGGSAKVVDKIEDKNGVEFFCETTGEFISKDDADRIHSENISESISYKYNCNHPALESDDPFVAAWIETKPEDFCSRFEQRKD